MVRGGTLHLKEDNQSSSNQLSLRLSKKL